MDMQPLMPNKMHATKKKPCCNKKVKAGPWLDGTLNTEYRNEFIDKEVPLQRASAKPSEFPKGASGKFDPSTTYGGDFKPYQTARPGLIIPPNSQTLQGGSFNGESTYKGQFGPKAVPYQRVRPVNGVEETGEFYGATTYNGDFMPRGVPAPAKLMTRTNNMEPSGPFEGESLYKSTFTKMPFAKRHPAATREGGQVMPKGDFDDGTIYKSTYVPKEVSMPSQFKPQDARPVSRSEWYGGMPSTEYRGQFFDKEVPATVPVRQLRGGDVLPKGPLDPSTTYGGDYKLYATDRVRPTRPLDAVEHEKLPFNGDSTYASAFIPKAVPYARVRPANAFEPSKAVFDPSTTHKSAYQAYSMVPAFRGGPTGGGVPKEMHPFEGKSCYKSDFTKMPNARREGKAPATNAVRTGPFDGTTTYRMDFVEKEIPQRERSCTECSSCDEDEDFPRRA